MAINLGVRKIQVVTVQKSKMHDPNRDILVISAKAHLDDALYSRELAILHRILFEVETLTGYCQCHEIIDVNRHKVIRKPMLVQQAIRDQLHKPFVFAFCKN